jgi:hypothetical protein
LKHCELLGGIIMEIKLPFGDPGFKKIIENNMLYVDKTKYIFRMLNHSDFCFLSRPRRFGKSLLIDTIDNLFRGDRKLFEGLWIGKPNKFDFKRHPVLNLCMTYAEVNQKADLIKKITDNLIEIATDEGIPISAESYDEILGQLLKRLSKKYGVGTVVLVDEYDSPVTKNITNLNLALDCRDVLHDFYESMKKNRNYIDFALVTGITRFAMTTLDSGPNNFLDISLHPKFAGICGFTHKELKIYFRDRFPKIIKKFKISGILAPGDHSKALRDMILDWYDGYNWLGSGQVLNPYSIIHFFDKEEFGSYWPISGYPSHLTALVRENPIAYMLPSMDPFPANEVRKSDISNMQPIPILFHSGYLTISGKTTVKKIEIIQGTEMGQKVKSEVEVEAFTFKTPNKELRSNFKESIFKDAFKPKQHNLSNLTKYLPAALLEKDSSKVSSLLHDLLTSISYHQHPTTKRLLTSAQLSASEQTATPAQLSVSELTVSSAQLSASELTASSAQLALSDNFTKSEQHYHAIIHGAFLVSGMEVYSEGSGANGRSEMVVYLKDKVRVVIEVKYCVPTSTSCETAMNRNTCNLKRDADNSSNSERSEKELSSALNRGQNQIIKLDYAGPYRASGCVVICMALAIRNRDEVDVRFFEY